MNEQTESPEMLDLIDKHEEVGKVLTALYAEREDIARHRDKLAAVQERLAVEVAGMDAGRLYISNGLKELTEGQAELAVDRADLEMAWAKLDETRRQILELAEKAAE